MRFRSNTNCQLGGECLSNGTVGERPEPSSGDHPGSARDVRQRSLGFTGKALDHFAYVKRIRSLPLARLGQKANAREQAEGQRLRGTNER
jgi:hypothetical protein